jgi:hypothetical protein
MSTSSINDLSSNIQSVLETALQGTSSTATTTGNNLDGINASTTRFRPDISQLSPFVELHALQHLLESDQTKYQQVTQQIATNLQTAAQTAQKDSNTTAANQLNQLASDFSNASISGQIPTIPDLAQAVGGGSSAAGSSSSGSLDTAPLLNQYLAGVQGSGTQSDPQSPLGIILNTLSSAGISLSNS